MKRQTILDHFDDWERLAFIADLDPDGARVYTDRERTILFIEISRERFISAARWGMSVADLSDFMDNYGEDYNYSSPAAFAFSFWRKHYAPKHYDLRGGEWRTTFCREALYGGRCEVYRYGDRWLYQYDINSSYPYSATQLDFPDPRFLAYYSHTRLHDNGPPTIDRIWQAEGASDVEYSQSGEWPILPLRHAYRIVYPIGERLRGVYTHTELRYALENGVTIHRIEKQYATDALLPSNPFADFAAYCYARRGTEPIYKAIANALFGRLAVVGNNLYRWRVPTDLTRREYRALPLDNRAYFGFLAVREAHHAPALANPLWSAMVLAYARIRLHSMISADTAYVDTDCVMCFHPQSYTLSAELGGLKEKQGMYKLQGAKAYGIETPNGWDLRLKGVSKQRRGLPELLAARKTAERALLPDGEATAAYKLDNVKTQSYSELEDYRNADNEVSFVP